MINKLPAEAWKNIFLFLPAREDRSSLQLTNKAIHKATQKDPYELKEDRKSIVNSLQGLFSENLTTYVDETLTHVSNDSLDVYGECSTYAKFIAQKAHNNLNCIGDIFNIAEKINIPPAFLMNDYLTKEKNFPKTIFGLTFLHLLAYKYDYGLYNYASKHSLCVYEVGGLNTYQDLLASPLIIALLFKNVYFFQWFIQNASDDNILLSLTTQTIFFSKDQHTVYNVGKDEDYELDLDNEEDQKKEVGARCDPLDVILSSKLMAELCQQKEWRVLFTETLPNKIQEIKDKCQDNKTLSTIKEIEEKINTIKISTLPKEENRNPRKRVLDNLDSKENEENFKKFQKIF